MHFHVIYEVLHSELVNSQLCLMQMKHSFMKKNVKLKLKIFKFTLNGGKISYNDDALKRSGVIEKGARYVEEIVAVNVYGEKRFVKMPIEHE